MLPRFSKGEQSGIIITTAILTIILLSSYVYAESSSADESKREWTFTVSGLTCDSCANSAATALKKEIAGVGLAEVDFESKKGTLRSEKPVTKNDIRAALATLGFEVRFADDLPASAPMTSDELAKIDVRTISHGEKVNLKQNLAAGKYTIFDYYADWCGPCRLLSPKLEKLVAENDDIALRKIDIVNWESDVARQASADFSVPGLPYVRVYGPQGDFLGFVYGNRFEDIISLLKRESS